MYDLYSRRIKDANGEPEVFVYDNFPETFRNQFFTVINNFLKKLCKKNSQYDFDDLVEEICEIFAQEKGLKCISGAMYISSNSLRALEKYIDSCNDEDFLDLMDFVFGVLISDEDIKNSCFIYDDDEDFFQYAIDELNVRLKQHSLGYEFTNGQIIKKTNTVTHKNIVKPALKLLLDEEFRGAEEEYLLAFEHFRKAENKDAIINAAKAFESTMKIICAGMQYEFDKNKDNAKKLINTLEKNSFYPSYLNNHITNIRTTLESGAPTVRNKLSGHGQGTATTNVTDEYVEYVLNLVATNIVFLYKIYKEKKAGMSTI